MRITPEQRETLAALRVEFIDAAKQRRLEKEKPETLLTEQIQRAALKAYDWLIEEFIHAYPDVKPGEDVPYVVLERLRKAEVRGWARIEEQAGVGSEFSGPLFGWVAEHAAEDFFKATQTRMPLSQPQVGYMHRISPVRKSGRESPPENVRG